MTTALWVKLFVTALIFISVILGWRITKCGATDKKWPWILALIATVATMVLGPILYHRAEDARKVESEQRKAAEQRAASTKKAAPTHYLWWWGGLPDGVYMHGRSESDPNNQKAELIPRRDGSVWADFHYMEFGNPQTERIRLTPTGVTSAGKKMFKGTFAQDDPEEHGRIEAIEVVPGVYVGDKIWQVNGKEIRGQCHLILN